MSRLNYRHLHYFWAVAKDGNLTRTAEQLHVSQSALSTQIKQLEDQLGQALFTRVGRVLQLTEAGRVALTYSETIFEAGNELTALLRDGKQPKRQVLRIGGDTANAQHLPLGLLAVTQQRSQLITGFKNGF